MSTRTVICNACDYAEDCTITYGEHEGEDDIDIPDTCLSCGNDWTSEYGYYIQGIKSRDEGREDFHSDG